MAGQKVEIHINPGSCEHHHQFEQFVHPRRDQVYVICRGCGYTERIQ